MRSIAPVVPALTAVLLLASSCAPVGQATAADGAAVTADAAAAAQDLTNFASRVLALHNTQRDAVKVPRLVWDANLAKGAAAYGPTLAAQGKLVHSPKEQRPGQGENLWMGTRGYYSLEQMVGSWSAEKRWFRAGTFPNVSTTGNWSQVAHYTQMIWRGTTRVGCAIHRSPKWDFLICRYSPAGNIIGQRVP